MIHSVCSVGQFKIEIEKIYSKIFYFCNDDDDQGCENFFNFLGETEQTGTFFCLFVLKKNW